MREVRGQARLVEEHGDELFLLRQVRKDALDGDLLFEAFQACALGAEHLRHSSRSELLDDAITLLLVVVLRLGHLDQSSVFFRKHAAQRCHLTRHRVKNTSPEGRTVSGGLQQLVLGHAYLEHLQRVR
jgi:hypothetical protein